MINVLVTCAGGFQGLTLYKGLKDLNEVVLHAIDINFENCSKYFYNYSAVCPPVSKKTEYIKFLVDYCIKWQIDFIIPSTAVDLDILAQEKESFKINLKTIIIVPDLDILDYFTDKKQTISFLIKHELPTLKEVDLQNKNCFPIIGKYRKGWGSKGITIIKDYQEFINIDIKNLNEYVWLPYINEFNEFSIDFSISEKGKPSNQIIRERNFITGGFAVVSSLRNNISLNFKNIIDSVIKVFSKREYFGLYNIQIIETDSNYYISDINPRIGTSAIFTSKVNSNIFTNILNISDRYNNSIKENIKVIRYLEEKFLNYIDNQNIKGLVFDLDDTLISSKDFIIERSILLFNKYKNIFSDKNDYLINVISFLNEGKAPFLIDELCKKYNVVDLKNEILEFYRNCYPDNLTIYTDVYSTLYELKNNGYKLYILTDNPLNTQMKKISLFKHENLFDDIFYTDSINSSKPNENTFNLICELTNIKKSELVMVGDNYYRDCIGAINSGFSYAFHIKRLDGLISHSVRLKDNFENSNKIIEIDSLNDLKELFNKRIIQ